jgi:hypothetical protein
MSKPIHPTTCQYCGAPIVFVVTTGGKYIPVDATSVEPGHDKYWDGSQAVHFKSCPNYHKPKTPNKEQMVLSF